MIRTIFTATLLLFWHAPAGWALSELQPTAPVNHSLSQNATVSATGDGLRARLDVSIPDFIALAARIRVDVGGASHALLYIYDENGDLVEAADALVLPDRPIWTELMDGNSLTILLDVKGTEEIGLELSAITGWQNAAQPDGIPDGVPEFEIVTDEATGFWAEKSAAVARLIVGKNDLPLGSRQPKRSRDWCTGFLISDDLLMTAAHCIKRRPALCNQTVALFGYQFAGGQPAARRCLAVEYMNSALDITVLRLSPTDAEKVSIPIPRTGPSGAEIAILQHPRGAIKLVSTRNCRITEPKTNSMPFDVNLPSNLLDEVGFNHSCDTSEGSSGSPVLGPAGLAGVHQGNASSRNFGIRGLSIARCIKVDPVRQIISVIRPSEQICKNEV